MFKYTKAAMLVIGALLGVSSMLLLDHYHNPTTHKTELYGDIVP